MKNLLSILTVLALAAAAQAGCGAKISTTGTLKSYDADKKEIVVSVDGKDASYTLTPETEGVAKVAELKGKTVKVDVDKHVTSKVLAVSASTAAPAEEPKKEKKKGKKAA